MEINALQSGIFHCSGNRSIALPASRALPRSGRRESRELRIFAPVSETTLTLENLTTGYGGDEARCVTKCFSTSLSAGDFVCLLGVNGSGKSTLLRTIAGLQNPISGSVTVGGKGVGAIPPRELARLVSVVLTDRQVFGTQMTVYELVSLGRIPYTGFMGRLSAEDRKEIDKALEQTGMDGMARRRISTLSDGERQKAMIARALAQQTPVMLLDEPTAFLDFPSKAAVFGMLRGIARNGRKTIVVSTHDLGTAFHSASTLWLLKRGECPECGSPHSLAAQGSLDVFFNGCGANFNRESLEYTINFETEK